VARLGGGGLGGGFWVWWGGFQGGGGGLGFGAGSGRKVFRALTEGERGGVSTGGGRLGGWLVDIDSIMVPQ